MGESGGEWSRGCGRGGTAGGVVTGEDDVDDGGESPAQVSVPRPSQALFALNKHRPYMVLSSTYPHTYPHN